MRVNLSFRRFLAGAFALLSVCYVHAQILQFSGSAGPAPALATPLVQHLGGGQEYDNAGGTQFQTNTFTYFLPNPTSSGNLVAFDLSFVTSGAPTPAISDNTGSTWPAPAVTRSSAGGTGRTASIYVLPNCNSGIRSITVTFSGAAVGGVHMAATEFNGVALSSPVNGTASAEVNAPSIATGSFTPTTNNDANGGNIILAYFSNAPPHNSSGPTGAFTGGSGFTLLDAGSSANLRTHSPSNSFFQRATEFEVQPTQAAVNPALTATGQSSSDSYLALAVALKLSPGAGTPAPTTGIYVRRMNHFSPPFPSGSATTVLNIPSQGNLRIIEATDPNTVITGVRDSDGINYTQVSTSPFGWVFYAANTTPNNALTVTITTSSGNVNIGDASIRFVDVERAKTSSVVGAVATFSGNINFPPGKTNDAPIITPNASNSLIFVSLGNDAGPILNNFNPAASFPTPTAATFCLINYTGQLDDSLVDNSDAVAIYTNPNTSAIHWNWVSTSQQAGNNLWGMAVEFLAGP